MTKQLKKCASARYATGAALAVSLAAAHESRERIDRTLARWEADQLQRGIRMNDLGVSLGNRIMNIVR